MSQLSRLGLVLTLLFAAALPARLAAELVWTPQEGWRLEGGVLAGLAGDEGRDALSRMNKARAAEEAGSAGKAAKAYEKLAKKYPNSVWAPEAYYRAGNLRLGRRQYYKAFEAYNTLVLRYPNSPRFNEVVRQQYDIANAMANGARNRIWGVIPSFRNQEKGIEYYERLLMSAPYSDYAAPALMNIARGHQKLRNTEEAIDALDRLINNYPQSLLAPDAYINLGKTHASLVDGPYYDQTSTREAITYYEDFMILFPGDRGIADAETGLSDMRTTLAESKVRIADYYFRFRQNYTAAKVFYNEAITAYPDSAIAARAREQLTKVEEQLARREQEAAEGMPTDGPRKKRFWIF